MKAEKPEVLKPTAPKRLPDLPVGDLLSELEAMEAIPQPDTALLGPEPETQEEFIQRVGTDNFRAADESQIGPDNFRGEE